MQTRSKYCSIAAMIAAGIEFLALSPARTQSLPPSIEIVSSIGHRDGILAIDLSSDGKLAITSGNEGTIKLWWTDKWQLLRTFKGHEGGTGSLKFLPDAKSFIAAGGNTRESTKVWEVESGRIRREIPSIGTETIRLLNNARVAFLPDGYNADFWDIQSAKKVKELTRGGVSDDVLDGIYDLDVKGGSVLALNVAGTSKLLDEKTLKVLKKYSNSKWQKGCFIGNGDRFVVLPIDQKQRFEVHEQSGRLLKTLHVEEDESFPLCLPNGSLASITNGSVRLIDPKTGNTVGRLGSGLDSKGSLAVSSDGKRLVYGDPSRPTLQLWDLTNLKLISQFEGSVNPVSSAAFLSNQAAIISIGEQAAIANLETGRLQVLSATNSTMLALSADRKFAVAGGRDGVVRLWDLHQEKVIREFAGHQGAVTGVAYSAKERRVASTGEDLTVLIWDSDTGGLVGQQRMSSEFATRDSDGPVSLSIIKFNSDSKVLVAARGARNEIWQIEFVSGRLIGRTDVGAYQVGVAFNAAAGLQAVTLDAGSGGSDVLPMRLVNLDSGAKIKDFVSFPAGGASMEVLDDQQTIVVGSKDASIDLFDLAAGKKVRSFRGQKAAVNAAVVSADRGRLISGSNDGTFAIWDAHSTKMLASSVVFNDGDWITVTPEGFFDASSPKAAEKLSVVRGLEVYAVEQFRDALFRPDLVKAKLAGDPDGAVKAAAAKLDLNKVVESGNAPKVVITSPADGSVGATGEVNVEANVTEQGGGVGRIEWRLNGQPVGIDTRGFERLQDNAAASGGAGATTKISQKMTLDAGDNVFEVTAYNARGLVASQPSRIMIKSTGPVAIAKPRLFVLAVGVNDYYDGRLKLNFAVPDARSIAASFEKAGTGFYDSVKAVTVLDGDVTRPNLEKVFTQLASEVKTSDVFVFFIAGHGRTLAGHYYFLPQDFRYRDEGSFAENGLSQEQWQKWITMVQARKSVLIYDTCESGSVANDNIVVASRGLQRVEEQAVAYEKLRDATGRTTLAASTDTQPALEGYRGHGVFSYVVMEALEKAQTNANGLIEVTGLISYVDDKVPDVSYQAFHQRQIPQNKMLGSNFAIARPTAMALETAPASVSVATPAVATVPTAAPSTDTATAKPTHVVITPADVYEQIGGKGAKIQQLPAGAQVTLVETSAGWGIVSRNGVRLGFIKQEALVRLQ